MYRRIQFAGRLWVLNSRIGIPDSEQALAGMQDPSPGLSIPAVALVAF